MLLSRTARAPSVAQPIKVEVKEKKENYSDSYIKNRDYLGAIASIEFEIETGQNGKDKQYLLAYCYYHLGEYEKAADIYKVLIKTETNLQIHLFLAACYFFMGLYKEAEEEALKGPVNSLQNRILFHVSHKLNDERKLLKYHQGLKDVVEDQLTLASIHYLRGHYQEAIDVYKKLLLDDRDLLALNVYVAMAYFKLDYFDISQEILSIYLQSYPDSLIATNLKACNQFKLFNGNAAEAELTNFLENTSQNYVYAQDLIKHNLAVFSGSENSLQVFTNLVDVIPEARLNLALYYLKYDSYSEAYELLKEYEPNSPVDYIVKAIVLCIYGQYKEDHDCVIEAKELFRTVGSSTSECDTIPGRQCMASTLILDGQVAESLVYLNSIKDFMAHDSTFHYNYGQVLTQIEKYEEAEESLLKVNNEKYIHEFAYLSHLAKCFIQNGKGERAWDLYTKMETSAESFHLLHLLANECFITQQYLYAARAFDILERLDSSPEYTSGKKGSCIGVFKMILNNGLPKETTTELLNILQNTKQPDQQMQVVLESVQNWAIEENLLL